MCHGGRESLYLQSLYLHSYSKLKSRYSDFHNSYSDCQFLNSRYSDFSVGKVTSPVGKVTLPVGKVTVPISKVTVLISKVNNVSDKGSLPQED